MIKEATLNIGTPPNARADANKLAYVLSPSRLCFEPPRLYRGILIPDAGGVRGVPPVERRGVEAAGA